MGEKCTFSLQLNGYRLNETGFVRIKPKIKLNQAKPNTNQILDEWDRGNWVTDEWRQTGPPMLQICYRLGVEPFGLALQNSVSSSFGDLRTATDLNCKSKNVLWKSEKNECKRYQTGFSMCFNLCKLTLSCLYLTRIELNGQPLVLSCRSCKAWTDAFRSDALYVV